MVKNKNIQTYRRKYACKKPNKSRRLNRRGGKSEGKKFIIHKLLHLTSGEIGGSYPLFKTTIPLVRNDNIQSQSTVSDLEKAIFKKFLKETNRLKKIEGLFTTTELTRSKLVLYTKEILIGYALPLVDTELLRDIPSNIYILFVNLTETEDEPINPIFVQQPPLPHGWSETIITTQPDRILHLYTRGHGDSIESTFERPRRIFPDPIIGSWYEQFDPVTGHSFFHNPETGRSRWHPPEFVHGTWWVYNNSDPTTQLPLVYIDVATNETRIDRPPDQLP